MGYRTGIGADAWRGDWLDMGRFILGRGLLLLSGGEVLLVSWFCLDCRQVGPLSKHGKCATCGSDAVTESEGRKKWQKRIHFIGQRVCREALVVQPRRLRLVSGKRGTS